MAAKYCEIILVLLCCYMKVTWAEETPITIYVEPDEVYSFSSSLDEIGAEFLWVFSTDIGYNLRMNCSEISDDCQEFFEVLTYNDSPKSLFSIPFDVFGPTIAITFTLTQCSFECDVTTERDESQDIPNEVGPIENFQPENNETCQCGWTAKPMSRIVGGKDAEMNEFPSTVLLFFNGDKWCGGTIIGSRVVLSAAHCFVNETDPNDYTIVAGENDIEQMNATGQWINLSKVIVHEYYDNPKDINNDIALLITDQEIEYSPKVGPACLPLNITKNDIIGKYLTVTGWGQLVYNGSTPNILQNVQVQVVEDIICEDKLSIYTSSQQICTYTLGKDSCQGDSGGPLYYIDPETKRYIIMGIVSYSLDCGLFPAAYTEVLSYLDWIKEKLGEEGLQENVCME